MNIDKILQKLEKKIQFLDKEKDKKDSAKHAEYWLLLGRSTELSDTIVLLIEDFYTDKTITEFAKHLLKIHKID